MLLVCAAEGCSHPLDGKRAGARYCSRRCYHREWKRERDGALPERSCEHCGVYLGRVRRDRRFCSSRCQLRQWRGLEPPGLSTYWREYLRRFDAALLVRTPENWAAFRELSPGRGRAKPRERALAELIRSLEV